MPDSAVVRLVLSPLPRLNGYLASNFIRTPPLASAFPLWNSPYNVVVLPICMTSAISPYEPSMSSDQGCGTT